MERHGTVSVGDHHWCETMEALRRYRSLLPPVELKADEFSMGDCKEDADSIDPDALTETDYRIGAARRLQSLVSDPLIQAGSPEAVMGDSQMRHQFLYP